MTQTLGGTQSSSSAVAQRLREARERAGLTLDEAVRATGLLRSYLASLEAGRRRPLPREVDRLSAAYEADLSDVLPGRRPFEVDALGGLMTVDGRSRRVRDLADDREVYAAYLFLLYAVRGAAPGERVPLRSSDVELLMQVVGDDAVTIERRLIELMGCTPAEATKLGTVLLRHRAVTAAVGAAAALSWVAVVAPGEPAEVPRPASVSATPISGGTSEAAYYDVDAVDGGAAVGGGVTPPVEDMGEGTWLPTYPRGAEGGAAAAE